MERRRKSKSKKKVSSDYEDEIEKMKEERRKFYKGLEEIEKLKKAYYEPVKTKNEEIRNVDEMVTVLTNSKDSHPGRKVFKKKNKFQCFTLDALLSEGGKDGDDYLELTLMLQTKLMSNETLSAVTLLELYYIMSMENDELTCQSCFEILKQNINIWTPTLENIFKVILNWGASDNTLDLTVYEKSIIFPNYVHVNKRSINSINADFCSYNYDRIFSYLTYVVSQTDKFSEREKIILIKYTLKIVLDIRFYSVLKVVKNLIAACINSIKNWDTFKVVNVSALIYDDKEHFHNQVAIVMDILPKISLCNPINSCLSLTVLRKIINEEVKFMYPYEDMEILNLVKMIEVNPNNGEELYKLYMIIHLLNHIVYHKGIIEANQTILVDLQNSVESLKWEVAKSKRNFDADLLRGRIAYSSTLWSLFSGQNVPSKMR